MRLAGAGWAQEDDVFLGREEVELPQVEHERLLRRALEGEVELLERLALREASRLAPRLATVRVSGCLLGLKQRLGEALVAPLLLPRPLGELRQGPGRRRCLHGPEEVGELGLLRHAGIKVS